MPKEVSGIPYIVSKGFKSGESKCLADYWLSKEQNIFHRRQYYIKQAKSKAKQVAGMKPFFDNLIVEPLVVAPVLAGKLAELREIVVSGLDETVVDIKVVMGV